MAGSGRNRSRSGAGCAGHCAEASRRARPPRPLSFGVLPGSRSPPPDPTRPRRPAERSFEVAAQQPCEVGWPEGKRPAQTRGEGGGLGSNRAFGALLLKLLFLLCHPHHHHHPLQLDSQSETGGNLILQVLTEDLSMIKV